MRCCLDRINKCVAYSNNCVSQVYNGYEDYRLWFLQGLNRSRTAGGMTMTWAR